MNKEKVKKILYDIFIKYQGIVILLIAIDQISKALALKYLSEPVYVFGWQWLQLKLQINSGVAFSFLKDAPQWITALISVAAAIAIEYYIIAKKPKDKVLTILLLVLVSGSLGNGIDRWLSVFGKYTGYSGVIDFIYPTFFANFNVADIYVTLSCIAMLLYFIFAKDDDEPSLKELNEAKQKLKEQENKTQNQDVDHPLNEETTHE